MPGRMQQKEKPASNQVLPVGGKFDGHREATICKPKALPQFHKTHGNKMSKSTVFDMVDLSQPQVVSVTRTQHHTDPFDPKREEVHRRPKRMFQEPERVEHPVGMKHIAHAERTEEDAATFVTTNGIIFKGGKQISSQKHATTYNDLPPSKPYEHMARFAAKLAVPPRGSPVVLGNEPFPGYKPAKKHVKNEGASLVGVLAIAPPRPQTAYAYRPPWGTNNTPRASGAIRQAACPPWATLAIKG